LEFAQARRPTGHQSHEGGRSVPGATALPKWRPQRPEMRSFRKRSRQSLTVLMLQDWLRLTAAKVCPPAKPRMIRTRRTSSARRLWLRLMRFNSRPSRGLNLKGAGMKKTIPQDRQMSLLQCTSAVDLSCDHLLRAGNRPSRSLGVNGPGSAISSRAACTWPHTFHNRTPRTRESSK
jgi:hypothetical protein